MIKVGSKVFYDQADGIPAGMLDSHVVLDAGLGNRAVGRCTVDDTTNLGLCTFSDGTGQFAGFHARVSVDCTSVCRWDGTYRFGSADWRGSGTLGSRVHPCHASATVWHVRPSRA